MPFNGLTKLPKRLTESFEHCQGSFKVGALGAFGTSPMLIKAICWREAAEAREYGASKRILVYSSLQGSGRGSRQERVSRNRAQFVHLALKLNAQRMYTKAAEAAVVQDSRCLKQPVVGSGVLQDAKKRNINFHDAIGENADDLLRTYARSSRAGLYEVRGHK